MSKLTVNKSRWTAYQGKEFENLMDYLDYQAGTQAVCNHVELAHLPSENDNAIYDNWYCSHCGKLVINNIVAK